MNPITRSILLCPLTALRSAAILSGGALRSCARLWSPYAQAMPSVAVMFFAAITTEASAQTTCVPVPAGVVGWWQAEGNAVDSAGSNNGALQGNAGFAAGKVGEAFNFDGVNGYVSVPASANLDVGLGSGFTLECWIKPNDVSQPQALVEWFNVAGPPPPIAFGVHLYISETASGTGPGCLYLNVVGTNGSYHKLSSGPGLVGTSNWQHVAATYDKATGLARLFYNGYLVASANLGTSYTPQTSYPLYLGCHPPGTFATALYYGGGMDEASVYGRALSTNEIVDIFNAGSAGKSPDTDGDGIPDCFETSTGIYVSPNDTGTSPTNPDSDGDGLTDGAEVNTYHSNPNVRDTDGDGFDDGFEVSIGFDPTSAASTPDTLSSIRTAVEYRFNAALGISYRIEASTDLANWATIETNIIGTGGMVTRFYSTEGQPKRFFRSRRN